MNNPVPVSFALLVPLGPVVAKVLLVQPVLKEQSFANLA